MGRLLVRQVDLGFNATIRDSAELPRGSAADGSQNCLYSRGTIKTPFGFDKVASGSLPLTVAPVLGLFKYPELDGTEHILATTQTKIFNKNNQTDAWDDVTQNGKNLGADIYNPTSHETILHTDAIALNGTGDDWYVHSLICPGESAPIQRWAGKFETDYADLLGGDDYHVAGSTYKTHFALQVGLLANHVLLISPRESDANNTLVENPQKIRYAQAGKLESWTGTGSGTLNLLDTGDRNVWGARLGNQWIQYQRHSMWSISHVGGVDIFKLRVEIPDLGLLAPHLLYSKNNIHYFVGNDFNVYAYAGGSVKRIIGDNIHRFLQRDLDPAFAYRSYLTMGAENSRLWLFIVPNGSEYITEAYGMDIRTGSWMKRDFTHKWTTATTGISTVALMGSSSYETGKTYQDVLLDRSPTKTVEIGGCSRVTGTSVVTVTTTTAHAAIVGDEAILAGVDSGGEANAFSGTHTVVSVPANPKDANDNPTTFTFSQAGATELNLAQGTVRVDKPPTSIDYLNSALTSRQMLTEVLSSERIMLGDSDGNVFQFSDSATQDDGVDIPCRHFTEVYDLGEPGKNKIFPILRITAKGSGIVLKYRTASFETTGTGWVTFSEQALTSEFLDYDIIANVTAKKIQFGFFNADGNDFQVSSYEPVEPVITGEI